MRVFLKIQDKDLTEREESSMIKKMKKSLYNAKPISLKD